MRLIIQRVKKADCYVNSQLVNKIDNGFMILVGFTSSDTIEKVQIATKKIVNLRIFEDPNGKMNYAINQVNGQILAISQFTLYANCQKGNRPSFIESMNPIEAETLYNKFIEILNINYNIPTYAGVFGADMKLNICCDGPVTISLEF